jgi:hypothetical protein
MSAHILNNSIEKINGAVRVLFSPHDRGTVNVLRAILVLSSAHDCAHASDSENLNTGCTLCEQQRELRLKCSDMVKGGGKKLCEYMFRVVKTVPS